MSIRIDNEAIINSIRPKRLPLSVNYQRAPGMDMFVGNFSIKDLGRGMLNHDLFCLVETLAMIENNKEDIYSAKIHSSGLDNLMLSLSLKAFLKSKKTRHKCNLAFLIPPFSYSFPLLLSYHLILQHLAETLSPELNAKFSPGSGILIISDNIELYSHIGRTSIQKNHLWQYINTYELKANHFKPFSFSKASKVKTEQDGSLPWITLFRAVRHQLPVELEMTPQVIILDLLPFRHRSRVSELLSWAKEFSQHVIVTAPLYDDNVYENLKKHLDLIIPIESYTMNYMEQFFYLSDQKNMNPVTASWSLGSSYLYFQHKNEIDIFCIKGISSLEELVKEIQHSLSLTIHDDGDQHPVFRKLKSLMNDMLSLPIPLEIYEQVRELNGKPRLLDIVKATLNVPSEEDKKLISHLLPQIVRDLINLYDMLFGYSSSPKGEALLELIRATRKQSVTIIVANRFSAQELKLWIRIQTKWTARELEHINIMTQEQWAKNHLNEIYMEDSSVPDHVILVSPWKIKYLSSFFIHSKSRLSCLSFSEELNLYRYQINKVYKQNPSYTKDLIDSFLKIPKVDLSIINITPAEITKVNVTSIKVKPITTSDVQSPSSVTNVEPLFDDQLLFRMIGQKDELELDNDELIIIRDLKDVTWQNSSTIERVVSIKITGKINYGETKLVWFVPADALLKIIKEKTILNINTFAVKPGDTWVLHKKNQRRELFETILKLSSNTMVMKWIELNVSEWRDMIALLWKQYHEPNSYKKQTYEKIRRAIVKNGGNVETTYTIANWINGDVSSVKKAANVRAVAQIVGEASYLEKWNTIYQAMRQLWNIHIKLGKVLGAIITDTAVKEPEDYASEWVNVGLDIKIPIDDIMASIELVEVIDVETNKDYSVPNTYVEKPITEQMVKIMMEKGMINLE